MSRGCVADFSLGRLLKWEFLFSLPSWEHQLLHREPVKTEGEAPNETLQLPAIPTLHQLLLIATRLILLRHRWNSAVPKALELPCQQRKYQTDGGIQRSPQHLPTLPFRSRPKTSHPNLATKSYCS